MKSRITIEVDFENNNRPVIQILQSESDDVRDNLLKNFLEYFGGSSWLKIQWKNTVLSPTPSVPVNRIHITPIALQDLKKESEIMLEQSKLCEQWKEGHLQTMPTS